MKLLILVIVAWLGFCMGWIARYINEEAYINNCSELEANVAVSDLDRPIELVIRDINAHYGLDETSPLSLVMVSDYYSTIFDECVRKHFR